LGSWGNNNNIIMKDERTINELLEEYGLDCLSEKKIKFFEDILDDYLDSDKAPDKNSKLKSHAQKVVSALKNFGLKDTKFIKTYFSEIEHGKGMLDYEFGYELKVKDKGALIQYTTMDNRPMLQIKLGKQIGSFGNPFFDFKTENPDSIARFIYFRINRI